MKIRCIGKIALPLLDRAVARDAALALAGALQLDGTSDSETDIRVLRHFLRRQGELAEARDFPWMASFLLDIPRIGTA